MSGALSIGQVVAGRFTVEDVIGEGGMGTVYLARHLTLPRQFAIKVLKPSISGDKALSERFRREAIAAGQVVHPNIVYITDYGELADGSQYMVMEYLEGFSLDDLVDQSGAQPLSRVIPILIQLADALDYSHRMGIVHRDIKPENILLCEFLGRKDVVKLVDFGIAKIMMPEYANRRITLKGQIFGTPEYISPEQAMDLPVDGKSDIYSLGIIAYELVTADPPFLGEPADILQMHVETPPPAPSTRMPKQPIPPGFDGFVLKCLAKNPKDRYPNAGVVRQELLKLRGLMAGMAEELLGDKRKRRKTSPIRVTTEGSWGSVSERRDPAIAIFEPELLEEQKQQPSVGPSDAVNLASSSTGLRDELHGSLKELAFSLSESGFRSDDLSKELQQILGLEEEVKSLDGKIAILEQNFERIRFESGEQETMLRHALLDLNFRRSQLIIEHRSDPDHPDIRDLHFQIDALQDRLEQVTGERKQKISMLNEEIKGYRKARSGREEEIARVYTQLHLIVEGQRENAQADQFQRLFNRLDTLSSELQSVRQSVRLMRPRSS